MRFVFEISWKKSFVQFIKLVLVVIDIHRPTKAYELTRLGITSPLIHKGLSYT